MTRLHYIIDKDHRFHVVDLFAWAEWMEREDHAALVRVAETTCGPYWISTIFLGLDHSFGEGPPVLWETMVFDQSKPQEHVLPLDGEMNRCAGGWEQAEAMHAEMVARVEAVLALEQPSTNHS